MLLAEVGIDLVGEVAEHRLNGLVQLLEALERFGDLGAALPRDVEAHHRSKADLQVDARHSVVLPGRRRAYAPGRLSVVSPGPLSEASRSRSLRVTWSSEPSILSTMP